MPVGYEILSCSVWFGIPCLWVMVDPDVFDVDVNISVQTTGDFSDFENLKFIGTIQIMNGDLFYHVFERNWRRLLIKRS